VTQAFRTALAALALALAVNSPAAAQRDPAVASRTERVTAIIESVDAPTRTVLLTREDGSVVTMRLGPEVRNFAQIRPGDRVVVEHTEAVAAAMARPGEPPVIAAEADARAPLGARPGVATADAVRVRVTIDQVFSGGQMVSFTGPTGAKRTIPVRSPAMQDFVRGLRSGDQVDVTLIDVVAIRVEPAP
jgi:translation initiation factor IF-1